MQYFWPALSDNWSSKPNFGLFESCCFKTGVSVIGFRKCINKDKCGNFMLCATIAFSVSF